MTRIVSPEEFVTAFDSVVRTRESKVASLWFSNAKFTRLMLAESKGMTGSDPHGFDRDNDGIGCESG